MARDSLAREMGKRVRRRDRRRGGELRRLRAVAGAVQKEDAEGVLGGARRGLRGGTGATPRLIVHGAQISGAVGPGEWPLARAVLPSTSVDQHEMRS